MFDFDHAAKIVLVEDQILHDDFFYPPSIYRHRIWFFLAWVFVFQGIFSISEHMPFSTSGIKRKEVFGEK